MFDSLLSADAIEGYIDLALPFAGQVLLGLLLLWIGWVVINWVIKLLRSAIAGKVDKTLAPFIIRTVNLALRVLLVMTVLSTVGVETTTFAALIGAFGVGAGLALSGMMQNFASAIIIFVVKPFEVGDQVQVNDIVGKVEKIRVFNTEILTRQRTTVYVPNSQLTTNTVTNYFKTDTQRFEVKVGIGYGDNHKEAQKVIEDTIQGLDFVLDEPKVQTGVTALGDNSVEITALYYASSKDFLKCRMDVQGPIKTALDKAGIEMPFPQIDVHQK